MTDQSVSESKMQPVVKRLFVAALKSGKYEQAQGVLHTENDGYCCLGVLAELLGCVWKRAPGYNGGRQSEVLYPFDAEGQPLASTTESVMTTSPLTLGNYLGPELLAQAGLTDFQQHKLAQMNDDYKSFNQIADFVERNL